MTPRMATGVTERLWEMTDIVQIVEEYEAAQRIEAISQSKESIEQ